MSVSFSGTTLPYAHVDVTMCPSRDKRTEFPGVDGADELHMGRGVGVIVVSGISRGTPSRSTLEGLIDGDTHTLSANGESYSNCKCVDVRLGPYWKDGASGGTHFRYTVTLHQLEPD